jgi:hypothetical protein
MSAKERSNEFMEHSECHARAATPDEYTRRTVRAFWADGLWDFATAGMMFLLAYWMRVLTYLMSFPIRTWPWPFRGTGEHFDTSWQVSAWSLSLVVAIAVYAWLAWQVVLWLKERWVAPHVGSVRHPFFLRLEPRFALTYLGLYIASLALLSLLFNWLKGGPYLLGLTIATSFSAAYLALGRTYRLPRYVVLSVLGLLISVALQLNTRTASYQRGPLSWWEVDPLAGNPTLVCLVFAVLLVGSGVVGLLSVRRGAHGTE